MLALRCWRAALPSTFNAAAASPQMNAVSQLQSRMLRYVMRIYKSVLIYFWSHVYLVTESRWWQLLTMHTRPSTSIPSSSSTPPTFSCLNITLSSSSRLSSSYSLLYPFSPVMTPTTQTRYFSASTSLAAKRNTYNPSRRVQKRRHGFLARLRSRGGRKILMRRRAKGRRWLSWWIYIINWQTQWCGWWRIQLQKETILVSISSFLIAGGPRIQKETYVGYEIRSYQWRSRFLFHYLYF